MLELRDVTSGYGDVTVLRNISMSCQTGSVVALLGPNGAGKTTLLRTISGLLQPTQGQILLEGEDMAGWNTSRLSREGVCHIPEGRGIFPSLTIKENLSLFSPKGRAKTKESYDRAASFFPVLGNRFNQTAGSLSGGEQQMLAIVRAYISNPRLVLVDEASMGLAPLIVDRLFEFLSQVSKEGTTLMLVEQYVNRVLDLADTVYLLNQGQIVATGKASEFNAEEIFERYLGVDVK